MGLTLSLCCSLSWGVSDFLGGYLGRRVPLRTVLLVSQTTGLALGLAAAFALGGAFRPEAATLVALGAGFASVGGVAALYRALSIGTMGVVAPIAATSALLPVIYGLALGERPGTLQSLGMAIALAGVITVSRETRADTTTRADRRAIPFALLAALTFGLVQVLLGESAGTNVWWTIGMMRVGAVMALGVFVATLLRGPEAAVERHRAAQPPRGLLVLTGVLDISAASFYAAATTHGLRSVVAVLGSLYPVVTVMLARVVLRERLARHQEIGAIATLVGVVVVGTA